MHEMLQVLRAFQPDSGGAAAQEIFPGLSAVIGIVGQVSCKILVICGHVHQAVSGQVSGETKSSAYQNLKLWLRFSAENYGGPPENLNLRIEQLLGKYRSPI